MPTPTYDLIEEKVLGSAQASVTFSSIPGTYKDLVLEIVSTTTANADVNFTVNGDSGTNYSTTYVSGTGTSVVSARNTNNSVGRLSAYGYPGTAVGSNIYAQFMSYANTSVNKTVLVRAGNASSGTDALVNLWRSTSAITTILISPTSNFNSGSTFRLWGVAG